MPITKDKNKTETKKLQEFYRSTNEIVAEFCKTLNDESHPTGYDSPLFDADELAKLLRKVWLNWARRQKDAPIGWLTEYERQLDSHKDVQRQQAVTLFAMGFEACLQMLATDEQLNEKTKRVETSTRSTVQAFTHAESRLLIAAVIKFVSVTLKKRDVVISKAVVDRLLQKLEVLANIDLSHVDYFVPSSKSTTSSVKAKWKKNKPSGSRGLSKFMKKSR